MITFAKSYEDIQERYIASLRALRPFLDSWWQDMVRRDTFDVISLIWPTGVSGHPRVLDIFRNAYFEVENLNRKNAHEFVAPPEKSWEEKWGTEDIGSSPEYVRYMDLLFEDIPAVAPDIADIVRGIIFISIGLNQDDEPV